MCNTFVTPWTVARQAPLSMRLSRHECWRGLSFPSPGDLPDPGPSPHLLHWQEKSVLASHHVCMLSFRSRQALCEPVDCSLPGSSVHGSLQAQILENTSCHALLQGIFPTQGSNLHLFLLLHWQGCSSPLAPPGRPPGEV